jgi:hypothetical protein
VVLYVGAKCPLEHHFSEGIMKDSFQLSNRYVDAELREIWSEGVINKVSPFAKEGNTPTLHQLASLLSSSNMGDAAKLVEIFYSGKFVTTAFTLVKLASQMIGSYRPGNSASKLDTALVRLDSSIETMLNRHLNPSSIMERRALKRTLLGSDTGHRVDDYFHSFTVSAFMEQSTYELIMPELLPVLLADRTYGKPLLLAAIGSVVNTGTYALLARQSYEEIGRLLITRLRHSAATAAKLSIGKNRVDGVALIRRALSTIETSFDFDFVPYRHRELADEKGANAGKRYPFSSFLLPSDPAIFILAASANENLEDDNLLRFLARVIRDWSEDLEHELVGQKAMRVGQDNLSKLSSRVTFL